MRYRPRRVATCRVESDWIFQQRGDIALLYVDATGPGKPVAGYSCAVSATS